ncbi:MAG: carboxypeptidase regulatory-like domain-containing protein [Bryobacteraceae bacterium]|jgi:hypothetical protein
MSRLLHVLVFCSFLFPLLAQDGNQLPVQRVVLYKNGVGYFEHAGRVQGNQDVTISFTSGQLNDVLKSLTVLDLNGGRISGVGYGSSAPIDRQIGDLRLPINDKSTLPEILGALRGAKVEVHSGATVVTGRMLSVERKFRTANGTTVQVDELSLMTESGDLRSVELTPAVTVRLAEKGLAGKMDRLLDLTALSREPDVRRMVISTEGSGERSLFVSYISEVPVWKTTYRIVLGSKSGPLLQGWAIVDNTVGEDWNNVQLSLVAGAPQSFIQNLSQPYYSRRPVVPLPESANIAPQTFESTLTPGGGRLAGIVIDPTGAVIPNVTVKAFDANNNLVGQTNTDAAGNYDLQSLPEGAIRLQAESPGFQTSAINGVVASRTGANRQDISLGVGGTAETVSVNAASPTVQTESSSVSRSARNLGSGAALGGAARQFEPPRIGSASGAGYGAGHGGNFGGGVYNLATAQALGDLFEYKLKQPITIQKNRSALVPIVQSAIGAEKVSVWNEGAGLPRPQSALWLTNSSGLTLDGGSFSVLEDETFAGEGVMDPIRPAEKRLVSYAVDLAVNASSKLANEQQRVTQVKVSRGVMTHISEMREKKTYTFRNEDTTPRTIVVEHPVRQGYELRGDARPDETTAAWMRFRLHLNPKETNTLVVEEARPIYASYQLTNLTNDQLALFVQQKSLDKTVEDALRRILAQKDAVDALDAQKNIRDHEAEEIYDDQQRLRENMKALKGTAEEKALTQRYTQQLNDQENRLDILKKESAKIEAQQQDAQAVLDRMIQELTLNVQL